MGRLFGTDGVRGIANVHPITAEMALEIGRAAAYVCRKHERDRHTIVIGKDTRLSGDMLESALMAGICSMGVDVNRAGVMTTPGTAFLTRSMGADAGMVVSASHNPYQDNGIKIFSRDGFKLPDAEEDEIEDLILSGRIKDMRPTAGGIGNSHDIDDACDRYVAFCRSTFPKDQSLGGMRIVLDCANGAACRAAPAVFSELGASVETIHSNPNGTNINDHCGSQYTDDLVSRVREIEADVGLAFDGDGDRLIAVDEKLNGVTGDRIMAICAGMYKEKGLLKNNLVVATVMSNFGFFTALKEMGVQEAVSKVGDRYVLEMMQEKGAVLGGEDSGHIIFLNHHTSGDGIVAALQLLWAMKHYGRSLSELGKIMIPSPQKIVNVDVGHKPPLDSVPGLQKAIQEAEAELQDRGRVLIRYSGTQPLCRVMVEGPTEQITERLANDLADTIRKNI
jgi:phosphoglucosamine mutase